MEQTEVPILNPNLRDRHLTKRNASRALAATPSFNCIKIFVFNGNLETSPGPTLCL